MLLILIWYIIETVIYKVGIKGLGLEFSREVDWAEVAEKIRWGVFAPEENVSALKKFIHEQGGAKTLRIITNDSSYYGDYVFAKALWPVVDGGVTAA